MTVTEARELIKRRLQPGSVYYGPVPRLSTIEKWQKTYSNFDQYVWSYISKHLDHRG
ncbi:MAG: hypothetical protein R3321_10755 [Nitrososphaeraceae archaeon]|nr:hypothetical protein [Nitrososphaeraceae archaeon]